MPKLLSPRQAAQIIGTNVAQIKTWARRAEDPLPSVLVGESGKFRKIIAEEIPAWLAREAERGRAQAARR
jgi:hypothetical protein